MKKKGKIFFVVFGIIILLAVAVVMPAVVSYLRSRANTKKYLCDVAISTIKSELIFWRRSIEEFKAENNRYPASSEELCGFIGDPNFGDSLIDGISLGKDKNRIKEVFDGKGGWFYDANSGTIKANLDKPINHYPYYKSYNGKYRNEIPSEW